MDIIDQCMVKLSKEMPLDDQVSLSKMSKERLYSIHNTFGRWVRNHFEMWADNELTAHMRSLGFYHPDSMSSALIKEFWNRMNLMPSEIMEDAKKDTELKQDLDKAFASRRLSKEG